MTANSINLEGLLDAKISDIQYNSLNLPIMITFTDGSTTRYTYDATGRKLRTEHRVMTTGVFNPGLDDGGTAVPDTGGIALPFPDDPGLAVGEGGLGAWPEMSVFEELEQLLGEELAEGEEGIEEGGGEPTLPATELPVPVGTGTSSLPYELTVTDYCGNFIYENGKLSRILFDGGFITFPDSVIPHPEIAGATCVIADITRPQYHYYFTDHLGSVRVVTDAQGNIEQTNNYYPYGGLMASSSSIATPSSSYPANQPYRYNGKELDRKNNLDWMDYGARHFAGHGQWTSPDPLAEKYYDWSPYVYCVGNPIKFVDPDGRHVDLSSLIRFDQQHNTNVVNELCRDLSLITGLDISVDSKGLLIAGETIGEGSIQAREHLLGLINNSETMIVSETHRSHKLHASDNEIGLGFHQIENFKKGAVNVDSRTMGWGMTFLHESYHTKMGGNLSDDTSNDRRGDVVNTMNGIRKELNDIGYDFGQRTTYEKLETGTGNLYIPFDENTLNMLDTIGTPNKNSKYIIIKR